MNDQILFYIVFLSQIFLISLVLPHRVLERLRYVVQHYPPQSYPRLYPVPMRQVERAQRNYRVVNLLVVAVGLALLAYAAWTPSEELLGWDTKTVVFLYYMLQYSPLMIATTAGFTYFNLKRKPTLSIGLSALELRHLSPVMQSLYFQVISVAAFRGFRIDNVNFEVYREDPVSA